MSSVSSLLKYFLTILCLFIFAKFLWKRRWVYYRSWVLPGPLSLPFVGSLSLVLAGLEGIVSIGPKFVELYGSVFRVWLGIQMFVVTCRVNDVEYILANCLHKENILTYTYVDGIFASIFTAKVNKWHKRRKNINHSFKEKNINSFFDVQNKFANELLKELELHCGKSHDLLPTLWSTTLNTAFETIGGVDNKTLPEENSKFVPMLTEYEKLIAERTLSPLNFIDWIWEMSSNYQKCTELKNHFMQQIRETIARQNKTEKAEIQKENSFIRRVLNGEYDSTKELEEEVAFMLLAASETTALVVATVLLAMSIDPEVQTKLYDEVHTLSELTLADLNNLDYLERVIKEAMRLLPPFTMIARYIDKSVELNGQLYPEGSAVLIPIKLIHRDPEFWPDPLKFDPDRFLSEEVKKRPRCAYLPFSFGPRNCIGFKYGMTSVKILLVKIIRDFEILPGHYKSLDEVETVFHGLQKPKNGCPIVLRKR